MEVKYRYDRRPGRRRRTRILIILTISAVIVAAGAGAIIWDLRHHQASEKAGAGRTVVQAVDSSATKKLVDEPTFSMELPGDWKEVKRVTTQFEHSITWQAATKGQDNRKMTLYIDIIPATLAVNKLLPVTATGSTLMYRDVSDNCATFTQNGSLDTSQAIHQGTHAAKWQQVDFLCDLADVVQNKIGTGSSDGMNKVTVTGPSKGAHKYFFLYTDHNIQPDNSPLYNAIKSFRAK